MSPGRVLSPKAREWATRHLKVNLEHGKFVVRRRADRVIVAECKNIHAVECVMRNRYVQEHLR